MSFAMMDLSVIGQICSAGWLWYQSTLYIWCWIPANETLRKIGAGLACKARRGGCSGSQNNLTSSMGGTITQKILYLQCMLSCVITKLKQNLAAMESVHSPHAISPSAIPLHPQSKHIHQINSINATEEEEILTFKLSILGSASSSSSQSSVTLTSLVSSVT